MFNEKRFWDLLEADEDVAVDLPEGKVDLVLSDPPYNVRKASSINAVGLT